MTFLSDYSASDVPTVAEINTYMRKEAGPMRVWTPTVEFDDVIRSTTTDWAWYGRLNRLVFFHARLRLAVDLTAVTTPKLAFTLPVLAQTAGGAWCGTLLQTSTLTASGNFPLITATGGRTASPYTTDGAYSEGANRSYEIGDTWLVEGWYEASVDED